MKDYQIQVDFKLAWVLNSAEFILRFFRPEGPCPEQWWWQWNSGRYIDHCFNIPIESDSPDVYTVY